MYVDNPLTFEFIITIQIFISEKGDYLNIVKHLTLCTITHFKADRFRYHGYRININLHKLWLYFEAWLSQFNLYYCVLFIEWTLLIRSNYSRLAIMDNNFLKIKYSHLLLKRVWLKWLACSSCVILWYYTPFSIRWDMTYRRLLGSINVDLQNSS